MLRKRLRFAVVLAALSGALVAVAASSGFPASGQGAAQPPGLSKAIAAQERHTDVLLARAGVVGTAVGLADGRPAVKIFTERPGVQGLPRSLDGVPVRVEVTGRIVAMGATAAAGDTTSRYRPAPIGVSTGHPDVTAGTIGARVTDGSNVYALSNNHVYADENRASTGDQVLQPGAYDGGTVDNDTIGTLSRYVEIAFDGSDNTVDAAIAQSTTDRLGNATLPDGYGTPSSTTVAASIGQSVQKYGRTTSLTRGAVDALNAIVNVGYDSGTARFVDQIVVKGKGGFIKGGDSGSLLVTDPGADPVGLLFAGNRGGNVAFANPIDAVLGAFGVTIDDSTSTPSPVTDIAVTGLGAPSSVTVGDTVDVGVTVENTGNQDVAGDITVTLADDTAGTAIGTKTISGLAAGDSTTLGFSWDTSGASTGDHTLTAVQGFADDDPANDSASTTVTVSQPSTGGIGVDSISPSSVQAGGSVGVTVSGSGFRDGASLDFENGSGPAPSVSSLAVVDGSTITATVGAKRGGPPRDRVFDVRVTNPDGSSGILHGGFTVTP